MLKLIFLIEVATQMVLHLFGYFLKHWTSRRFKLERRHESREAVDGNIEFRYVFPKTLKEGNNRFNEIEKRCL